MYVCSTFFQRELCQKLYLFHFSSRINKTWYKVSVIFGSFDIGPNFWFNCHLGSWEVTEVNTCNFVLLHFFVIPSDYPFVRPSVRPSVC